MRKELKRNIRSLTVLEKHRNMELENAAADVKRAKKVLEKAQLRLNEASAAMQRAEISIRESMGSDKPLVVQDLQMKNNYLQNLRHSLSRAKTQFEMSSRVVNEATELLVNKNQQLQVVERLKDSKKKQYSAVIRNHDISIMDELSSQKREIQ